jgi:SAM-dependent methyltransferase
MPSPHQRRTETLFYPPHFYRANAYWLTKWLFKGKMPLGSFDVAVVDRLLQHVRRPLRVLREMGRALKQGGRVLAVDVDWGSLVIDHPNMALTRQIVRLIEDSITYPWAGRRLRGLMAAAGFERLSMRVSTVVATNPEQTDLVAQVNSFASEGLIDAANASRCVVAAAGALRCVARSLTRARSLADWLARSRARG